MRALTQSPSDKGLSSMRTYRDAKLMAKNLRQVLGARQLEISHSASLEIVAKQFGCDNWNILSARISAPENPLNSSPQFEPAIPILRIFSVEKPSSFTVISWAFRSTGSKTSGDQFICKYRVEAWCFTLVNTTAMRAQDPLPLYRSQTSIPITLNSAQRSTNT